MTFFFLISWGKCISLFCNKSSHFEIIVYSFLYAFCIINYDHEMYALTQAHKCVCVSFYFSQNFRPYYRNLAFSPSRHFRERFSFNTFLTLGLVKLSRSSLGLRKFILRSSILHILCIEGV